jgi:hypothetical protein
MKDLFYVVSVFGGIEPTLIGPYESGSMRDMHARRIHFEQKDTDSMFWLNIVKCTPTIGAYTASFLEDSNA